MYRMKKIKIYWTLALLSLAVFVLTPATVQAQKVGRWEKLGEQTASASVEKDVIDCSNKGLFTAIKFRAERAPVSFIRVLVRYANGSTDNLKFDQTIRAGEESPLLDLRGNKRAIKQIEIHYKTEKKSGKGKQPASKQARVQVWGRH